MIEKLLVCFGTRPEWIKIKPLLEEMQGKISYKVLFTGQHLNLIEKKEEFINLQIKEGENRLDSIVVSILNNNNIFEGISHVLVQGDTTSAFAVALAAFHRKIKIIHLEAGLRTYDLAQPYPEEFNRQTISKITDFHLCPTNVSYKNLLKEKAPGKKFIVGNTVLDNIINLQDTFYDNKILITMHRRENIDSLKDWFKSINDLASIYKDLEFIFPMHPNPEIRKYKNLLSKIKIIEPLEYGEFVKLLSTVKLVITDSGGIQEESSFLRKKCIICREKTERVEGLGIFSILCKNPRQLKNKFKKFHDDYIPIGECPYGDGFSCKKIVNIFMEQI